MPICLQRPLLRHLARSCPQFDGFSTAQNLLPTSSYRVGSAVLEIRVRLSRVSDLPGFPQLEQHLTLCLALSPQCASLTCISGVSSILHSDSIEVCSLPLVHSINGELPYAPGPELQSRWHAYMMATDHLSSVTTTPQFNLS